VWLARHAPISDDVIRAFGFLEAAEASCCYVAVCVVAYREGLGGAADQDAALEVVFHRAAGEVRASDERGLVIGAD
jgi:hypothetical protein